MKNHYRAALTGAVLFLSPSFTNAQALDILFVGNSFTHGYTEPALSYNNSQITDANGGSYGGVPGIFKQFSTQESVNFNVTIEAVGGRTLQWHYDNKASIIGQPNWDTVVLQEQSTLPLPASHGGNQSAYLAGAQNLQNLILSNNSAAEIFLYETWASPTSVSDKGYTGLQDMQDDVQAGIYDAYYSLGFDGVARVGDAFLRAVDQGIADADPSDGISPGMVSLWANDDRHASAYGSYLSAAVLFGKIANNDTRSLDVGVGSAAEALGLDAGTASALNQIAYEINTLAEPTEPPPATTSAISQIAMVGSTQSGNPDEITGDTTLTSISIEEGTFGNLHGATAENVVTSNSLSSIGTAPASANEAVSGLSLNDGVNNLQSGDFQFGVPLDEFSRFFIIENAPQSSTSGDSLEIELIDIDNNIIGSYNLELDVSNFTNTVAGNTSNALATIEYTSGQGNLVAKLSGVSFALSDFSGSGGLEDVTGIRITSGTLDPNVVGVLTIPEPSTLLLTGMAIAVAFCFNRNRKSKS